IASASSSTCGSACVRSICCAASEPSSCIAASCAASTKSRSSSGGAPPSDLRLFRRLVFGFLLERLPDGLEADEPLFVRRQRARRHETRTSIGNRGFGGLLLAHVLPPCVVKSGRHPQALAPGPVLRRSKLLLRQAAAALGRHPGRRRTPRRP